MKKNHIQKLFDRINGGDDVDAAAEAQEIAVALLVAVKRLHHTFGATHIGSDKCSTCILIKKATS